MGMIGKTMSRGAGLGLAGLVLAVLAGSTAVNADTGNDADRRVLTVSGQGEVHGTPNEAMLSAGVVTTARTAASALADNSKAMNAVFATLKRECVDRTAFATRTAARQAIFSYIEGWYNSRRRHSALGYLSPAAFEQQCERASAV